MPLPVIDRWLIRFALGALIALVILTLWTTFRG